MPRNIIEPTPEELEALSRHLPVIKYVDQLIDQEIRLDPTLDRNTAREKVLQRGPVSLDSPFHKLLDQNIERVTADSESNDRLAVSARRTLEVLKSAGVKDAPPTNDPAS
jgi:hypothetical protein